MPVSLAASSPPRALAPARGLPGALLSSRRHHSVQRHVPRSAAELRRVNEYTNALTMILDDATPAPNGTARRRPLEGLQVAIKDNIAWAGHPLTCASPILSHFVSPYDADCVDRLQRIGGATIVARANMDEFGMGSHATRSTFGPVINPWGAATGSRSQRRSAGGSSGGCAAAVASGALRLAIGSDTGGSVRTPAAYCGVVGFKPTYGAISRHGLVPYASSLDTVGILADTVGLAAAAFAAIRCDDGRGRDASSCAALFMDEAGSSLSSYTATRDPVHRPHKAAAEEAMEEEDWMAEDAAAEGAMPLAGTTVAVIREMLPDGSIVDRHVREAFEGALEAIAARGAIISRLSMPSLAAALATYYVSATVEAASCLARYPLAPLAAPGGPPSGTFGPHVALRLALGRWIASHRNYDLFHGKARACRQAITADFARILSPRPAAADYIVAPTAVGVAPLLEEVLREDADAAAAEALWSIPRWEAILASDFANGHLEALYADLLTVPASLARLPAISLPIGGAGLPVGLQVIARAGLDDELLAFAAALTDHLPAARTHGDPLFACHAPVEGR